MNTLEFRGQPQLLDAITAVSAEQGPDLAVVRGFITEADVLNAIDDRLRPDRRATRTALYAAAPILNEADELVVDLWNGHGYKGMSINDGLLLDQVRIRGIAPHIDDSVYGDRSVEAVAQMSLCLKGQRWFNGERLPVSFRGDDGAFDLPAYQDYTQFDGELYRSVWAGRQPRSRVLLHAGDLALFGHHPVVTLHSVTHDEGQKSVARLLTWRADKN